MSAGAARLCGRCGRVRPISKRAGPDGPDICSGCYRPPIALCTACGQHRPCTGIAAGRPVCLRCAPRRASLCAHCGKGRPAVTHWPEGPVCDTCYTAALRRTGICVSCQQRRRLLAPPGPGATTCAECARIVLTGHVCTGCGCEDKLYERGYCDRCALARRADVLLGGARQQVPAVLAGVRDAIVSSPRPRTALNWLRRGAGAPLLAALAEARIPLSHAGLDAQPAGRAVDYLRALLVAHGALPERDEALARLERRVAQLLGDVGDVDDRRILTAYATWRVLHQVRRRAEHHPAAHTATRHASVSLRAAIAVLDWLSARGIRLEQMRQADLDHWLLDGPSNLAYQGEDFLAWAAARRLAPRLVLTRPVSPTGVASGQAERQALIHTLLYDPSVPNIDRVTGCLNLLYAQQLSRIAAMTRGQVHDRGDVLSVRFGRRDVSIDEPLAGFIRVQLEAPRRHESLGAPTQTGWLFPGHLPGRPITAARLGARLGGLGINAQAGRRAAMQQLAAEVPAAVLADLLGLAVTTAVDWAHAAGGDWSRYAADTARDHRAEPVDDVKARQ